MDADLETFLSQGWGVVSRELELKHAKSKSAGITPRGKESVRGTYDRVMGIVPAGSSLSIRGLFVALMNFNFSKLRLNEEGI